MTDWEWQTHYCVGGPLHGLIRNAKGSWEILAALYPVRPNNYLWTGAVENVAPPRAIYQRRQVTILNPKNSVESCRSFWVWRDTRLTEEQFVEGLYRLELIKARERDIWLRQNETAGDVK